MSEVNLKTLEDELFRCGLASFRKIKAAHPTDRFYCYAFYTSGEYGYVVATASTYEGLEQVARRYKTTLPAYKDVPIEDLRLDLKWSPCDSPLHDQADDPLHEMAPLIQSVAAELTRLYDLFEEGPALHAFVDQVEECFAQALRRIDATGIFGQGDERDGVVVNLLMGDQSDEARIEFAHRVNPPQAVRMLIDDLAAQGELDAYDDE